MAEGYVDTKRVAEYLAVSEKTVKRLRDLRSVNGFPCHRVSGQWRYKLSEIELWVQRQNLPEKGRKPILLVK